MTLTTLISFHTHLVYKKTATIFCRLQQYICVYDSEYHRDSNKWNKELKENHLNSSSFWNPVDLNFTGKETQTEGTEGCIKFTADYTTYLTKTLTTMNLCKKNVHHMCGFWFKDKIELTWLHVRIMKMWPLYSGDLSYGWRQRSLHETNFEVSYITSFSKSFFHEITY